MSVLERVAGVWFAVLDASALAAAALASRVSTRRRVTAVEGDGQELLLYPASGPPAPLLGRIVPAEPGAAASRLLRRSQVALELDPGRFVFRSIDLPGRAGEFIDAIVRTQIDRLTPWRPEQVMFGCSSPIAKPDGGITLTVAATDRSFVTPLIERVQALGASVVEARVSLPAGERLPGAEPRLVVARVTTRAFAVTFWRRCLGIATAVVVVLVIAASLIGQFATMQLGAEAEDLDQAGAAKRAVIARALSARDPATAARRLVQARRGDTPFATLVLDDMSRILPDNTFVTGFELKGARLRLTGFTADAPALIRLLETSGVVAAAGFSAPTTRLPDDPGDRFSIEATLRSGTKAP